VQEGSNWRPAIKLADSIVKLTNPGLKQAWRIYDARGRATADLVTLEDERPDEATTLTLRHPSDPALQRSLSQSEITGIEPLLVEVLRDGQRLGDTPTLEQMRTRRRADVERLDSGVRRLVNPHIYHVSLSESLWSMKQELLTSLRSKEQEV
jgi:nicotinate phosphoribosyltransferase